MHVWQEAAWQRLWTALDCAWGELPTDLPLHPVVQRGNPGQVLVGIACQADDLLIIGAGRRGTVGRMRSATVSRYCLAHAGCPVLAIPPAALAHSGHGWPFRRRAMTMDRFLRDGGSVTA